MLSSALTFFALLAVIGGEGKVDKKLAADQLLRETIELAGSLPWDERIRRLERVTHMNRKYAAAFYELACVRMEKNTIENRRRAAEAIERAVSLSPANAHYRYTCGVLCLRRGMAGTAEREFRKAAKLNPGDPQAHHQLGLLAEERMLHYRDMFNFTSGGILDLRDFADDDYLEAQKRFQAALDADPKFAESYYRLALLYFESGRLEEMNHLLQKAIRQGIGNKDHYLFLGLSLHEMGDDEAARRAYDMALEMMPPGDRELFESLQTVLPKDSAAVYLRADAETRIKRMQQFWTARDPFYLTPANERLIEHYGRVAYANLRYSFPNKGIEGWKTDRGKTLIRFGRPRRHYKSRADLGTSPTGRTQLNPSREVWDYGDFQLVYEDRFLNRNYSFAWGFLPETDSKYIFDRLVKETPERYDFPFGGKEMTMQHVIAQFRGENDSTQVEVYYGLPEAQMQPGAVAPHSARYLFDRGFFVFDRQWEPLLERREYRILDAPRSNDPRQKKAGAFVLDRLSTKAKAGAYTYAMEIRDRISQHAGSARASLEVEDFSGPMLKMSSVVLASNVAQAKPADGRASSGTGIYTKDGLDVVPMLKNEFSLDMPVYVYYEVYNLQPGADSLCRFRIDSRIEPLKSERGALAGALRGFGRLLGMGNKRTAITSSFESGSFNTTEKLYHALEIAGVTPGRFELTLTVNDLNSGEDAGRRLIFEITNMENKK
jgi:GWxTD domain-containing protein